MVFSFLHRKRIWCYFLLKHFCRSKKRCRFFDQNWELNLHRFWNTKKFSKKITSNSCSCVEPPSSTKQHSNFLYKTRNACLSVQTNFDRSKPSSPKQKLWVTMREDEWIEIGEKFFHFFKYFYVVLRLVCVTGATLGSKTEPQSLTRKAECRMVPKALSL